MFDNIASLRFHRGPGSEMMATAMVSAEGETMDFRHNVPAEGRVEDWMTQALNEMRKTNRLLTKEAIFYYCADNQTRYEYRHLIPLLIYYVVERPHKALMYVIYLTSYKAEPSNPKGITGTAASEGSM